MSHCRRRSHVIGRMKSGHWMGVHDRFESLDTGILGLSNPLRLSSAPNKPSVMPTTIGAVELVTSYPIRFRCHAWISSRINSSALSASPPYCLNHSQPRSGYQCTAQDDHRKPSCNMARSRGLSSCFKTPLVLSVSHESS